MKKMHIIEVSLFIAFLNFLDALFTIYGISQNFIDELNPLMKAFISIHPILFLLFKGFLSAMVIFLAFQIMKRSSLLFKKSFYFCLFGIFFLYSGVLLIHLYWLTHI